MKILKNDITGLHRDDLATFDEIEQLTLVFKINIDQEPALQLLELEQNVNDRDGERLLPDGLRLFGEPVHVGHVDDLTERWPTSSRGQTVDGRKWHILLAGHIHHRVHEHHEESCTGFDLGNISLRHDSPRCFGLPIIPA